RSVCQLLLGYALWGSTSSLRDPHASPPPPPPRHRTPRHYRLHPAGPVGTSDAGIGLRVPRGCRQPARRLQPVHRLLPPPRRGERPRSPHRGGPHLVWPAVDGGAHL